MAFNLNAKKPRILMVSYPFDKNVISGGSRQAITLSSLLIKKIPVIAIGSSYHNRKKTEIILEKVDNIPTYRILFPKERKKLFRTIDLVLLMNYLKKHYDIVHFHGFEMYPLCIFTKLVLRKKNVIKITLSEFDDPSTEYNKKVKIFGLAINLKRFKWFLFNQIDKTIAISEETYKRSRMVLPEKNIIIIPNGVDMDIFKEANQDEKNKILKKHNFMPGIKKVLFIGEIGKRKSIPELLEAWKLIKDIHLILVGPLNPSFYDKITFKKIVDDINRQKKKIYYFTFTSNPVEFYQVADLFVFLSKREGHPNVVLESMSCNLPVLALKRNWVKGFLNSSISLLINNLNPQNIANVIEGFFSKNFASKKGQIRYKAKLTIQNYYSLNKIAKDYLELYYTILS